MENVNESYDLYRDIKKRTNGEIYIGVVGPVRTGKSTFIKRFMELVVIPEITDEDVKMRTLDELPMSANGKMIMTTEPKFIPKDAALVKVGEDVEVKIRLVDCVGYMTQTASGHMENGEERLVKTPWFEEMIPFTKAAEIGTKKVINDHSTIGIVITCDGSFGDISRDNYIAPEEKTIKELKSIGKPFIVLLNTNRPYASETVDLAASMEAEYGVRVLPVNCEQLKKEDINRILENVLYEFPVNQIAFYVPKWIEMLDNSHPTKQGIIEYLRGEIPKIKKIRDLTIDCFEEKCNFIRKIKSRRKELSMGSAFFDIEVDDEFYFAALSDITGAGIKNEYELIDTLRTLAKMKDEYERVRNAIDEVNREGYGVVRPLRDEIELDEPEVIKNGNKFGVKIRAKAPSVHMIKADVLTEIAPIVGTKEQADDLIDFIKNNEKESEMGIWDTNIFGKSIEQIVNDGINTKIEHLTEATRSKMQETIQKITNDSKGGVICIII